MSVLAEHVACEVAKRVAGQLLLVKSAHKRLGMLVSGHFLLCTAKLVILVPAN